MSRKMIPVEASLAKWRKEGCSELFAATVEVPDEVLND